MNDENGNLVLDVLHKATSQDTETLRSAEKQLKVWESEPGFYTVLMVWEYTAYISYNCEGLKFFSFVIKSNAKSADLALLLLNRL